MGQRFLFVVLLVLTIIAVNVWHFVARYIVHEAGLIPGLLALIAILLLGIAFEPYWD